MKIDDRLSAAQCDALAQRMRTAREAYEAKGDFARAGAMDAALDLLHQARSDAFRALVKQREARMPKTIFGKPTHL